MKNLKKVLEKLAVELNSTLGLEPAIKLDLPLEELKEKVIEAIRLM